MVSPSAVALVAVDTLVAPRPYTRPLVRRTQAAILAVVGNKMNAIWKEFVRWNPGFNGKVWRSPPS